MSFSKHWKIDVVDRGLKDREYVVFPRSGHRSPVRLEGESFYGVKMGGSWFHDYGGACAQG